MYGLKAVLAPVSLSLCRELWCSVSLLDACFLFFCQGLSRVHDSHSQFKALAIYHLHLSSFLSFSLLDMVSLPSSLYFLLPSSLLFFFSSAFVLHSSVSLLRHLLLMSHRLSSSPVLLSFLHLASFCLLFCFLVPAPFIPPFLRRQEPSEYEVRDLSGHFAKEHKCITPKVTFFVVCNVSSGITSDTLHAQAWESFERAIWS